MTTIAGTIDGDRVIMGCDSQVSFGWTAHALHAPKLAKLGVRGGGQLLIGISGRMQYANVVQHRFTPPAHHEGDALPYLIGQFVPALQQALDDAGLLKTDNGVKETQGTGLIGYRGRLFHLGDFDVTEVASPFNAVGSGQEFALGAMHASEEAGKKLVTAGLEAAAAFDRGTSGPFTVWSVS